MARIHIKYLGLLGLVAASSGAQAITIDNFSTGNYNIVANASTPAAEAVRLGLMLGFQRDALVEYLGGPLSVSAVVNGGGVQFFNSDSQTTGALTLQYDGIDFEVENGVLNNDNNLNANLSNETAFVFDFRFVDPGLASSMTLMTTVLTGNGTFTASSAVPAGTNLQIMQDFSMFGAADFSDVQRIDFRFTGSAGTDFTLDNISTVSIPGPAAALAFFIGLSGRLRRKSK